ncbi:unnamed protein product [Lactuca virosa]|uniref:Uncharacterized protein n=1 Tax=Lactuca virosa TaxID=75947 RepID=A0AAU9MJX8_9ASTR|nr:unnamed protein product [Lactuca virosa]
MDLRRWTDNDGPGTMGRSDAVKLEIVVAFIVLIISSIWDVNYNLHENLGGMQQKHDSGAALHRWGNNIRDIVIKEPKRRVRFTANLPKLNDDAGAMPRTNQQLTDLKIPFHVINDCTQEFSERNFIRKGGYGKEALKIQINDV